MITYNSKLRTFLGICLVAVAAFLVLRHGFLYSTGDENKAGSGDLPELAFFTPASSAELRSGLDAFPGSADDEDAFFAVDECGVTLPAPQRLPDDLWEMETGEKKSLFIRALLPHIIYQNALIRRARVIINENIDRVRGGTALSREQWGELETLFSRYRLSSLLADGVMSLEDLTRLRIRVDVIPPSLALAQAAMESGWGTSRFVQEGNNLFGHWQFRGNSGIVPLERPDGESYTIARFEHLSNAVERYMLNLNTHWAYKSMRQIRASQRANHQRLNPEHLAKGLAMYSSRREGYVADIIAIMHQNNLMALDKTRLSMC